MSRCFEAKGAGILHPTFPSQEVANAYLREASARGIPDKNVEVRGAVAKGDGTLNLRGEPSAIGIKGLFTAAGIYPIRVGKEKEGRYAIRVAGLTADEATKIAESLTRIPKLELDFGFLIKV